MRQFSMVAALVLVVLLAVAAAWYFVQPGRTITVNAPPDNAAFADSGSPLGQESRDDSSGLKLPDGHTDRPRPRPEPEPDPDNPDAVSAPGPDEWQICGQVALAPDLAKLLPDPVEWGSDVMISYLADGDEPDATTELYASLDDKLRFRDNFHCDIFGMKPADDMKPGRWQVLYGYDGDFAPGLYQSGEVKTLMGLVTPKITGRVIDLGTVTVGADMFFYDSVVLTGRLVHTSGRALSYAPRCDIIGGRATDEEDFEIYAEAYVNGDGSFVAVGWWDDPPGMDELAAYQWILSITSDTEWAGAAGGNYKLGQPAWTGNRGEFGEIKLGGALIELVLKADFKPEVRADGSLKMNRWGEYEGDCATINFDGSGIYADAYVYPQPIITCMLLPEGRYIWNADAEADDYFPSLQGLLLAREGQVHRLELEFKPYPSIPLKVRMPEGAQTPRVDWTLPLAEYEEEQGNFNYSDTARIPVLEGKETSVTVTSLGCKPASAIARLGMASLEITLTKSDVPLTTLTVVVPVFPKGLTGRDLSPSLQVRYSGGTLGQTERSWGVEPTDVVFTFEGSGPCTIGLYGGRQWGYPDGVLSGPVQFEIAAGESGRVELPALADPPWEKAISNFLVSARTSGRPIDLQAWVRYSGRDGMVEEDLNDGQNLRMRGMPVAFTDGVEDYPLQMSPGQGNTATLAFDLPHVIEVKLTRAGQRVEQFEVRATRAQVVQPNLNVECSAIAVDGVAWLWMPAGKVNVDIRVNGSGVAYREVEVTAGQVTQIDAGSDLLRLTLEVPKGDYDPDNSNDSPPHLWTLQYIESGDDEETRWADYTEFSKTDVSMLSAGRYRVVPWRGGTIIEIELSEDKVVTLPELAPPSIGAVVLKYDIAALGTADADIEIEYQLTSRLTPGQSWVDGHWVNAALVPDGIRLVGLPLETEIVLWGAAWVFNAADGAEYQLLLRPLKLTISKDGLQVDAVIKRGVQLDEEWFDFEARWLAGIENFTQGIGEYAMPGRTEIAIYENETIVYREWVTIPETSEEPIKIPDTLRQELIARELIDPEDE